MVNPLQSPHTGYQTFVIDDCDGPDGMFALTSGHRFQFSPPQVPFLSLDQDWQYTIGSRAFQSNRPDRYPELVDQLEDSLSIIRSSTKPLPIPITTLKENIRPLRKNGEPKSIKAQEPIKSNYLRPHMALANISQRASCEPKNLSGLAMAVFATNSFNDKEIRKMECHAALTLNRFARAKIQADLYRRRCAARAIFILHRPTLRNPVVVLTRDAKKVTIGFNPVRLPREKEASSGSDSESSYPDYRI